MTTEKASGEMLGREQLGRDICTVQKAHHTLGHSGWAGLAALAAGAVGAALDVSQAGVAIIVACTLAIGVGCLETLRQRRDRARRDAAERLVTAARRGHRSNTELAHAICDHGIWEPGAWALLAQSGSLALEVCATRDTYDHAIIDTAHRLEHTLDPSLLARLIDIAARTERDRTDQIRAVSALVEATAAHQRSNLTRLAHTWHGDIDQLRRAVTVGS